MSRLVNADELKLELKWLEIDTPVYHDVMSTIDEMPSIDAVEVVRCKDCKHYKGLAECYVIGDCMGTNGYCAWGERREER